MSIPTSTSGPCTRAGKPINIGDTVTVTGAVTSVTGTSDTATVAVTLYVSGNSVNVQAKDIAASTQTL
jgi:acyl-CoA hydrolase